MSFRKSLLAGAAILCGVSLPSAAALAQEAEAAPAEARDVVVVTARRREESLTDVPVAVSALSGQQLETIGAADITTLQAVTPNATVQVARGSNSTLISFIRGVGQQDPLWGFEPGVGLYVDDVYVARPQGAVLDILDIERIEALRGPLGTLYGRNTIGGAIKYVTRRLGDEAGLTARASVGSYGQLDYMASGALPLDETFSVGGAFARYKRDGYGENLTTGQDHYNKDVLAYRVSAEWEPADALFFRLAFDRVEDDSNPRHGSRLVAGAFPGSAPLGDIYDTNAGLRGVNSVMTQGASLTGEWSINENLTFKSITAMRDGDTDTVIDFDNTPSPTLDIPAYYADEQFTQEFQLAYEGDRLQGVVGYYYLDGSAEGAFDTVLGVLGITIGTGGNVDTTSHALFGDFSYDVNDRLSVSLGARYTEDEKTGDVFRANYLGVGRTPLTGGAAANPILVRTDYTNTRSFDQFTPRISASYDFGSTTAYASFSQGFKSGGFDMRGDAIFTPNTVNGYDPETVDTYEVGFKGEGIGGILNFSSALFWSEYQDQQVTTQVPAATGIASFVDNVGQSTIYGAEFEGTAFLTEALTANFALGWLQAEFDEFLRYDLATATFVDISDQVVFQNSPEFTGYLGLTWTGEAFGGDVAVTPSIAHRSSYSQFEFPNALLDEDGYTLIDLSAVWSMDDGAWQIGLYGKNLTDEEYRIGGYNFPGAAFDNSVVAFYGPPRTFTATLTYRY